MNKIVLAVVGGLVLLLAVGLGAWFVLGGEQEAQVRGTCGGSAYELSVEEEDGMTEVNFELQSVGPNESWEVVVDQDGTPLLSGERTTDSDGELDVDAGAREDGGDDFTVTATPESGEECVATLTR